MRVWQTDGRSLSLEDQQRNHEVLCCGWDLTQYWRDLSTGSDTNRQTDTYTADGTNNSRTISLEPQSFRKSMQYCTTGILLPTHPRLRLQKFTGMWCYAKSAETWTFLFVTRECTRQTSRSCGGEYLEVSVNVSEDSGRWHTTFKQRHHRTDNKQTFSTQQRADSQTCS